MYESILYLLQYEFAGDLDARGSWNSPYVSLHDLMDLDKDADALTW